ncbi:PREDICTED: PRA1 family protein 2-like [Priapulus caudatus]|uniref:PRA1 family protein n=1 Tax=Priapulus caudatus TaxID=37621 RepID=A0ABM1E971_PRICU|nr:PREDICTED: PRA1 family protein 2-like [Priapulus caudatus]
MASPKIPVKMESEVEFAPLRTLTDFMLESARFQLPNLKDPERWMNRVNANLLYYQSNYFVMALLTFVVVGFMHPIQMLFGCLGDRRRGVVIFIAASVRCVLRNIKNKVANKMEMIGLKRTPMGLFLDALGQEQDVF